MIPTNNSILHRQATERLRQEKETFDQQKRQDKLWFYLKIAMGLVSIILLLGFFIVAATVLLNPDQYGAETLGFACYVLLVDVLGLVICVWKVVLGPRSNTKLNPVTAKIVIENDSSSCQFDDKVLVGTQKEVMP